jgi:hypothetical protein
MPFIGLLATLRRCAGGSMLLQAALFIGLVV